MLFVNLLPQELRRKEIRKLNIPYRPIAIGFFSLFLVFATYNLFLFIRIREEWRSLQKQWSGLADRSAQADQLERELGTSILKEVDFYDSFVDPSLPTSKVLNLVSDLIPLRVWLTRLKLIRKQKEFQLVLDGLSESAGAGGSRLVEIQNFANKLKDQMEQSLGPSSLLNPNAKKSVRAAVTTSSQRGDGSQTETTRFTATFETEGFAAMK